MTYFLYIFIKFISYFIWCYIALLVFPNNEKDRWGYSLKLAFGRFFIGLVAGIPIVYSFYLVLDAGLSEVTSYMVIAIPFRLIEWSVLLANSEKIKVTFFQAIKFHFPTKQRLWLLGGILISSVLDALHFWAFGNANIKLVC